MIIRVLLILGLVAIGYLAFLRRGKLPFDIIIIFGLLGLGAVATVFAEHTDVVANWVGVERGADLVTYVLDVVFLFMMLLYYTKFVELQQRTTSLVREIALLRAQIAAQSESDDSRGAG